MLELALELKEAIKRYSMFDKMYMFSPTETDWRNVGALVDCLKVFYNATLKLSGTAYPTLNIFFTEFCEVFMNIKQMASSPLGFIVSMGREMLVKWDKYWDSGNQLLALACVLDPRCKMAVVEYYYGIVLGDDCQRAVANLKSCMAELFKEYSLYYSKAAPVQMLHTITSGSGMRMKAVT